MVVRGGWLLLLMMLSLTVYDLGRLSFRYDEKLALRASDVPSIQILLHDNGGRIDGIHQINDVSRLVDVINLAGLSIPEDLRQDLLDRGPFSSGEMLVFQVVNEVVVAVDFAYMPAAMRMTLDIPLQVNQMSATDWQDLRGIGPTLALRIENDCHKNGDFGALIDLNRVKGVGSKRIEEWKPFFSDN